MTPDQKHLLDEAKTRVGRVKDHQAKLALKKLVEICEQQEFQIESMRVDIQTLDSRTSGLIRIG